MVIAIRTRMVCGTGAMADTRQGIGNSCRSGEQFEQEKPLTDIPIARCFGVPIDQLVFFYLGQSERKYGLGEIIGRVRKVQFVLPHTVMFKICLEERRRTADPFFHSHSAVDERGERGSSDSKLVPEPGAPQNRGDLPAISLTKDLREPNEALVLPIRQQFGQRIVP